MLTDCFKCKNTVKNLFNLVGGILKMFTNGYKLIKLIVYFFK